MKDLIQSSDEMLEYQRYYINFLESIIQALGFLDQKKDFYLYSVMVNKNKALSFEELYCYKAVSETYGNVKDQNKINLNQLNKIMNQDEFPVCDQTTLTQIKLRISQISKKLENSPLPDNDKVRIKWQSEILFLKQYFLRAVNQSGKIRCFSNFTDQSRKKVICGIKRSLERISLKSEDLANYINSSLSFGIKLVSINANFETKTNKLI